MKAWKQDQLQALLTAKSEGSLFDLVAAIAKELGFDHCAYGLRVPLPVTQPRTLMYNNYPVSWQHLYHERDYLAVDPVVQWGMRSLLPLTWPAGQMASAPEFWEEARCFGLETGWAQATISPEGVRGMLTLTRGGEPLTHVELAEQSVKLVWLTQIAHHGMSRSLMKRAVPESDARLTAREIEMLRWTAEGKTSGEISMIVNIAERTVNFHLNNVMAKLNASNKTAAVVRAVVLGLLQ